MSERPPQLSPLRMLAGVAVPLAAYWLIRSLSGSTVGALAITDAVPSAWLLLVGIVRRRVDPIPVLAAATVVIAFAAYALSGGDPLAIELRRGAVTGVAGVVALVSVAFGRPLLLTVAQHVAALNPDPEMAARLVQPERRRAVTILTALVATTLTVDGATQVILALTVPTASFVPDSTMARVAVFVTGALVTVQVLRNQKTRFGRRFPPPSGPFADH